MFDTRKMRGEEKWKKGKKWRKIKNRFKVNKLFIYIILNLLYKKNYFLIFFILIKQKVK